MGWESFGVVRFDLGPLLQGQMRIAELKSAYNSLISRIFDSSYVLGCGRDFKMAVQALKYQILHNIFSHISTLRSILYTLPF